MKLNGWLRLWIVLSACWLTIIGYFGYTDVSTLYGKKKFELSKEGLGEVTVVFSASQSDSEIRDYASSQLVPLIKAEPGKYRGKVVTTPYDMYVEKNLRARCIYYAKIAFGPILSLLALGVAAAWVKRGFAAAE
jgi:hypothetical protein